MTCSTSRSKGSMPVRRSQRPKTSARRTSHAARYASGAGALVLVLDPGAPGGPGRGPGVDASPGLDARLLVGREHVLIRSQAAAPPATGVQVEDGPGPGGEVGVPGEDPAAVAPGPDGVLGQPAPEGRARDGGRDAPLDDRPAQ